MHENITKHTARLLVVSCAALWIATTRAQEPAEPSLTLKQVGPGVWAVLSLSNSGFVIGDDGVALIDTLVTADASGNLSNGHETTKRLLAEIRKLTKLPIKYVVNTHYHLDHTGGNAVFAGEGAVIVAQHNVREWIHAGNLNLLGKDIKPEQKAFIEALAPPAVGYDRALDLYLGSRRIQVRSFPGHTGGDSVVLIPDAKAAFGGDLFWRNTLPNLVDGTSHSWVESLDKLIKDFPDYTFVPGHGDAGRAQDFVAFRDYLALLRKLVAGAQAQGKSGSQLVEAVAPALTEKYSQWDYFKYFVERNILDIEAEMAGKKKLPQTQLMK